MKLQGAAIYKSPTIKMAVCKPPLLESEALALQPASFFEIDDLENGYAEHEQKAGYVTVGMKELWHVPPKGLAVYFVREIHPINSGNKRQRNEDR
jgi:hypothetical protein